MDLDDPDIQYTILGLQTGGGDYALYARYLQGCINQGKREA